MFWIRKQNHWCSGAKFYTWLRSWSWDISGVPTAQNPRSVCLARYNASLFTTGAYVDACACPEIVTDCHRNGMSEGSGPVENSAPFNVFNSPGAYDPPEAVADRKEWWNAIDPNYSTRHECDITPTS